MAFFRSAPWAVVVPTCFIAINYISYRYNVFSAMERKGDYGDLGTVYFPISLLMLAAVSFGGLEPHFGGLGILIMGYGDGLAAVIGQSYGKRTYVTGNTKKSVEGSLAMFAASLVVALVFFSFYPPPSVLVAALTIATAATLLEGGSPRGLDNLTVPLGVSLLYYLLFY